MSSPDIQSINRDEAPATPRLGKSSPILSYFCVYNPSLGQSEENTKDQILYYTAKKVVPADVKMKQVGLAQALVNFTSTFSPSHPTQNVHSQKNRLVFLQPEPGFWMHMCIELGVLRKQIKDAKGKEKLVTEYLDAELDDSALEAVLTIGYEQFKLLNGTFTAALFGNSSEKPTRQRTRSLMHAIEEFFSEWIWKWDFDRLYTMCFTAVFNGVPSQPVLRVNYLRIHELDTMIKKKYNISHMFALNLEDGALVYRSPDLLIRDVCALRKYVIKRVEHHLNAGKRKLDLELATAMIKKETDKVSGLKQFTKSLSQSHILSYFSSGGSKSTDTTSSSTPDSIDSTPNMPVSTLDIPTAPTSPNDSPVPDLGSKKGIYLTGLIESTAIAMSGQERPVTKSDLVRVYISSPYEDESGHVKDLTQYYLLVYKHKSDLIWSFLLPATSKSEDMLSDPLFYTDLESYMTSNHLDELTNTIKENITDIQEKSLNLGKNYQCFYYDNATLNMKSTIIDPRTAIKDKKAPTAATNEMLLQLLQVREDLRKFTHTNEVYTRSTANYWIAGNRLYNKLTVCEDNELSSEVQDYAEIYLIASKKDTSLADVEETLTKMSKSLLETMHIE